MTPSGTGACCAGGGEVAGSVGGEVRVRFCPSPTGVPHLGLVRTALFNWAFARQRGGKFIFRIEDTDSARDSEESYQQLLGTLRWLGLDWDEGVEKGGPYGPYRQSERSAIYADALAQLLAAGLAYESFSTPEEIEARNLAAGRPAQLGYDNYDRDLTQAQREEYRQQGRAPIIRLRMPDEDIVFEDLVRGQVRFAAGSVPDFALARANGDPLYTLVNPLDDALMKVTHVLRGEDLLSSTPRQIALYRALMQLGLASQVPVFGHLPMVLGEGNKKLSKRNPEANFYHYQQQGFIREGILNYLALLGWSISADRDLFTLEEMTAVFDPVQVKGNPARFDYKKCLAVNGHHLRQLTVAEFLVRLRPFLPKELTEQQRLRLERIAPLVQERVQLLTEAVPMVEFLLNDELIIEPDALAALANNAAAVLQACLQALQPLTEWETEALEAAARRALVDEMGLKPKQAFAPLRVAIAGRRVSPPLFESMEILGKDESLARINALLARLDGEGESESAAASSGVAGG